MTPGRNTGTKITGSKKLTLLACHLSSSFFETVLFHFVEQVRFGAAQVDDFGTSVAVLLLQNEKCLSFDEEDSFKCTVVTVNFSDTVSLR